MSVRLLFVYLFFATIIFANLNCETDKFFGYKYDAERINNEVEISGLVTNVFTNEPVRLAEIDFEGQQTRANFQGQYNFRYMLTGDEAYDRAINIHMQASQFHDFDTSVIIYPEKTTINARMVYGAPIITNGELNNTTVTATIFDYQGISDVDSVYAIGFYFNDSLFTLHEEWQLMEQVEVFDNDSAVYVATLPEFVYPFLPEMIHYPILRTRFSVFVVDKSKFRETRHFSVF